MIMTFLTDFISCECDLSPSKFQIFTRFTTKAVIKSKPDFFPPLFSDLYFLTQLLFSASA